MSLNVHLGRNAHDGFLGASIRYSGTPLGHVHICLSTDLGMVQNWPFTLLAH